MSFTPFVKSGLRITRGKYAVGTQSTGTAGLIVRRHGETTGAYLLTCSHVLGLRLQGAGPAAQDDNAVYAPHFKEFAGCACNGPIGEVVSETLEREQPELTPGTLEEFCPRKLTRGSEHFAIDAALVKLVADINSYNRAPEIGQIHQPRDLIAEWALAASLQTNLDLPPARHLAVKKFGARTRYTEGTIRRLARVLVRERVAGQSQPVDTYALVFRIDANPGQNAFSAEFELDMDVYRGRFGNAITVDAIAAKYRTDALTVTPGGTASKPTLKFSGHIFADAGDSGAPVVDQAHRVVGILRTMGSKHVFVRGNPDPVRVPTGDAQAMFVDAALSLLGVDFLEGGQHAAGSRVLVPGMAVDRAEEETDWSTVRAAGEALGQVPTVGPLVRAAREHFDEIRSLIHRRRRVTVTWHRHKGPAFLVAFVRAAERPTRPPPVEIDGVRLIDTVQAMRAVLMAEGSAALRAALVEHDEALRALAERPLALDAVYAGATQTECAR